MSSIIYLHLYSYVIMHGVAGLCKIHISWKLFRSTYDAHSTATLAFPGITHNSDKYVFNKGPMPLTTCTEPLRATSLNANLTKMKTLPLWPSMLFPLLLYVVHTFVINWCLIPDAGCKYVVLFLFCINKRSR